MSLDTSGTQNSSSPRRILIVNVNWLGDIILSTPFIRNLRKSYPDAYIACLVVPRGQEILNNNPCLDKIIIFDEEGAHKGLRGKLRMISLLKKTRFTHAYFIHRSFTRTLLAYLAGIPHRIGYYSTLRKKILLTKPIPSCSLHSLHRADYFLKLLEKTGIQCDQEGCDFFISPIERTKGSAFLTQHHIQEDIPYIVLNPGGNWPNKRWPQEHFAALAEKILLSTNYNIVITGAPKDTARGEIIQQKASDNKRVFNLCGKTNLSLLGYIFEKARLIITNDTGPMHLASALGKDILLICGPTSSTLTGPFRNKGRTLVIQKKLPGCRIPCYTKTCKTYTCMEIISPEEVWEKTAELLNIQKHVQGDGQPQGLPLQTH